MLEIFLAAGIPAAITGLLVWYFKRYVEKKDKQAEKREKNVERLMLMIMNTSRANNVLATATAKAVQRIPDAKCNGDMTEALAQAAKYQQEEKDFLINQGIENIFGEV